MTSKIVWEKAPEIRTGGKKWFYCAYPLAPYGEHGYPGEVKGWIVGRVIWNRTEKSYQIEDFRVGHGLRIGIQNFGTPRAAQKAFELWWKQI